MSAAAVRCPHCGAFQGKSRPDAPPTKAAPNYREAAGRPPEPQAPVAKPEPRPRKKPSPSSPGPEPEIGVLEGLFLPHPSAHVLMRAVEWLVIALELPLLCASLLGFGILVARMRFASIARGSVLDEDWSDGTVRVLALLSGFGVLIAAMLRMRHLTLTTVGVVIGSQVVALAARLALRSAARRRAALDLTR